MNRLSSFANHLCYLPGGKRVGQIPANAIQNDFRFIVTQLEWVRFDHAEGASRHTLSPYHLPTSVFATQPLEDAHCIVLVVKPG